MTRSSATIETEFASRYLQQLCKHFAHKIPVEFSKTAGRMEFEGNTCLLEADQKALTISIQAADADINRRLQDVIVRHLDRFAFRDRPEVRWKAG
ncbi:DUF2218 domain-containing protein [Emcibacter sp. SYSU 3D8]|uniref:DUF2218 domain-containing protein n=1 Tax=Emcibacter sp. SYSU 3D8 TaxID=3133969 RepID=UPI0031FE4726